MTPRTEVTVVKIMGVFLRILLFGIWMFFFKDLFLCFFLCVFLEDLSFCVFFDVVFFFWGGFGLSKTAF